MIYFNFLKNYHKLYLPLKKAKKAKKGKKTKASFSKAIIKEIREEFNESRHKFSRLKIKEVRENLYKIEKGKNLSKSKIKEIEKNLTELEGSLLKSKTYYEYDDSEYRGIRNARDLLDLSIDEDYYELILVKSAFDGNYNQYESGGGGVVGGRRKKSINTKISQNDYAIFK